jgi:hypothetical protein
MAATAGGNLISCPGPGIAPRRHGVFIYSHARIISMHDSDSGYRVWPTDVANFYLELRALSCAHHGSWNSKINFHHILNNIGGDC